MALIMRDGINNGYADKNPKSVETATNLVMPMYGPVDFIQNANK